MRNWFSNKGQIVQTSIALIACMFGGIRAWPDMHKNDFFSAGSILFYLLVALVVGSVVLLVTRFLNPQSAPGKVQFPPGADRKRFDTVRDQLTNLSAFERFALANLLSADGMTGEQFNLVVERLGFPATSLMQQDRIKETFSIIDSRTALLVNRDSVWAIKPELKIYISTLIDQMKPLFGF